MSTEEVTVDNKGRILIPKEVRDKVGLRTGGKARLKIVKENIVIRPRFHLNDSLRKWRVALGKETLPSTL